MNLDAVLEACERLPEVGIATSHTTVSTVGWVPGIKRMATEGPRGPAGALPPRRRAGAALGADAGQRPLPAARGHRRLPELARGAPRRKVYIEYLMLAGVNDNPEQALGARRSAEAARGLQGQPDPIQPDGGSSAARPASRSTPSRRSCVRAACRRRSASPAAATSPRRAASLRRPGRPSPSSAVVPGRREPGVGPAADAAGQILGDAAPRCRARSPRQVGGVEQRLNDPPLLLDPDIADEELGAAREGVASRRS